MLSLAATRGLGLRASEAGEAECEVASRRGTGARSSETENGAGNGKGRAGLRGRSGDCWSRRMAGGVRLGGGSRS
jgi:hypothetical protein